MLTRRMSRGMTLLSPDGSPLEVDLAANAGLLNLKVVFATVSGLSAYFDSHIYTNFA